MKFDFRNCCLGLALGLAASVGVSVAAEKAAKPASAPDLDQTHNFAEEIEAEVASHQITLPAQMDLAVEWHVALADVKQFGRVVKAWLRSDLVLLETEKHALIAIRRADGVELWVCQLTEPIRYAPAVSNGNVVVNLNNDLQAINRVTGELRWRLRPNFVMSCEPMVLDPLTYPQRYTREGAPLETLFVGGWDNRMYSLLVRGRMRLLARATPRSDEIAMPEFELNTNWQRGLKNQGTVVSAPQLRGNLLYYSGDDKCCYWTEQTGEEREPYVMLGAPTTDLTVTPTGCYQGATDNSLYCLDRMTMHKKWAYPAGNRPVGTVVVDDAAAPYVYCSTDNGVYHALKVAPAQSGLKGGADVPETVSVAWELQGAAGTLAFSPSTVYVGLNSSLNGLAYKTIEAVDKANGKVLWKCDGAPFTEYLVYHNPSSGAVQPASIFALTADNRLVCLKEKSSKQPVAVVAKVVQKPKAVEAAPEVKAPDAAAPVAPAQ